MANLATETTIAFETLRLSLSLVRKARAAMSAPLFAEGQSKIEVNFHLGCAEIALLRLILEEERDFNESCDNEGRELEAPHDED